MLPILAGDGVLIFGRASNALPFSFFRLRRGLLDGSDERWIGGGLIRMNVNPLSLCAAPARKVRPTAKITVAAQRALYGPTLL